MTRAHLLLLVALVGTALCASSNYVSMFEEFKLKYDKHYKTPAEEAQRLRNFVTNMKKAEIQQKANPHATFGVNGLSDLSPQEFKVRHSAEKWYAAKKAATANVQRFRFSDIELKSIKDVAGEVVDWRNDGVVTAVKNQGQCGCCWAFSTTGNIEGQWALAGHGLVSLSEQELVSCDTTNSGCNGGLMDYAWQWMVDETSGLIATEASYPFVSGGGQVPACAGGGTSGAQISSYQNVAQSEPQMAAFVAANGPLSIALDATSFETYNGGIITNCISQQVDHAVLIVGFDTSFSPPYWIIKNSWGPSWGEAGYVRVEYGQDECLITTAPCSSIV